MNGIMSKRIATKAEKIRYDEHIGLMPGPGRTEGGQRRYADTELQRMSYIRHSRQFGFSLDAIHDAGYGRPS